MTERYSWTENGMVHDPDGPWILASSESINDVIREALEDTFMQRQGYLVKVSAALRVLPGREKEE
jgi:hypothetical protein